MSRFSIKSFCGEHIIITCIILCRGASKNLEIEWENSGEITFLVPSEQWFQFSIGINSTSPNTQSIAIEIIGETNWGINQSKFIIRDTEISNQDSFELGSVNLQTSQ